MEEGEGRRKKRGGEEVEGSGKEGRRGAGEEKGGESGTMETSGERGGKAGELEKGKGEVVHDTVYWPSLLTKDLWSGDWASEQYHVPPPPSLSVSELPVSSLKWKDNMEASAMG